MTRKKVDNKLKLSKKLFARVSDPFYNKMESWLSQSNCRTMAELTRKMLYKEEIIWYHKDASLESVINELAGIRRELNAIGNNVNQVTRYFNSTIVSSEKWSEASLLMEEYKKQMRRFRICLQSLPDFQTSGISQVLSIDPINIKLDYRLGNCRYRSKSFTGDGFNKITEIFPSRRHLRLLAIGVVINVCFGNLALLFNATVFVIRTIHFSKRTHLHFISKSSELILALRCYGQQYISSSQKRSA